ncbi:MAG: site-specific integrase [Acidobacteria bacterium]|nr:site-specific integrase [Acidobacteriota bacterium]
MRKRAPRRRYQRGCIRNVEGSWILKYYDAERKQRTKTLGPSAGKDKLSRNHAERAAAEFLRPFNEDPKERKRQTTLAEFVEKVYVPIKRNSGAWRKGTEITAVDTIEAYLLPHLGTVRMSELEPDHFRQVLLKVRDKGLGKSVLSHVRTFAKAICKMAHAEGYIDRDITAALDPVTPKGAQKEKLTVTKEDYALAKRMVAERERLALDLVMYCGLRESEVYALQVGDLMEGNVLEVRRSWHQGAVNDPKSFKGRRKVGVPPKVMEALRTWAATLPDSSAAAWLFPSSTVVTPLWGGNILGKHIKPKLKPVGLDWLNFAIVRRTHSTEQEKLKTDPRIVAKQQGHSMDVHYREYVQTDTSELEAAATLLHTKFDETIV